MTDEDKLESLAEAVAGFHASLKKLDGHTVVIPLDLALLMVTATKMMVEKGIGVLKHLPPNSMDSSLLVALYVLIDHEAQFKALAGMVSAQAGALVQKGGAHGQ